MPVTKLVSVKRRASEASQCANASALSASGETADSGAEPGTNTHGQLIAVLLPEGATMRRARVIVVSTARTGRPANRGIVRSECPRRRVERSSRAARVAVVEPLPVSRLLLGRLELRAVLSGNLVRRFRRLIRRLISRRKGV